jgi:hypothetical protein
MNSNLPEADFWPAGLSVVQLLDCSSFVQNRKFVCKCLATRE